MAGYIGTRAAVASPGTERKKTFAITTTTTNLTGLSYTPGFVHVYHNGIRLVDSTDYTATDGSTITLTTAAENGDEVVVVSYGTFSPADAYTKAEADDRYVNASGDTITGDFSVDGATFKVDSTNNRVGIGTSSPDRLLTLKSDGETQISFKDTGGTSRAYIGTDGSFGSAPTGALRIRSDQGGIVFGISGTETARIDTSGRVTMPFQPSFWALATAHTTASGIISFPYVHSNVGGFYNATTSTFTAPVSGRYLFTFSTLLYSMGYSSIVQLHVNGAAYGGHSSFGVYGQFTGSYAGQGASSVVYLNANDAVTMYLYHNVTNLHLGYTWWSGCLLG